MVSDAAFIDTVLPEFLDFCGDCVLVAHNANFDMSFIKENTLRQKIEKQFTYIDTVAIARILLPHQGKHTLDAVARRWGYLWKTTTGQWTMRRPPPKSL